MPYFKIYKYATRTKVEFDYTAFKQWPLCIDVLLKPPWRRKKEKMKIMKSYCVIYYLRPQEMLDRIEPSPSNNVLCWLIILMMWIFLKSDSCKELCNPPPVLLKLPLSPPPFHPTPQTWSRFVISLKSCHNYGRENLSSRHKTLVVHPTAWINTIRLVFLSFKSETLLVKLPTSWQQLISWFVYTNNLHVHFGRTNVTLVDRKKNLVKVPINLFNEWIANTEIFFLLCKVLQSNFIM